MEGHSDEPRPSSRHRVARAGSRRAAVWTVATLLLTLLFWLGGLAGLLALADRVHVDIPPLLAARLPLLRSGPRLIFAGESRNEYGVDPELAAAIAGDPAGAAVNIAYDAGEPLAFAAAAKLYPDVFRNAHVVLSIAPFLFNDGVRPASVYPLDVAARLGIAERLWAFLPLRIGTLTRYIREAFASRLAQQQHVAEQGAVPPHGGLAMLDRVAAPWPDLGQHPYYAHWSLAGPKSRYEIPALCDLAKSSAKLTVVDPPWIPADRSADADWIRDEGEMLALLRAAGQRCGFDVLKIFDVPGLAADNFADEMHVNTSGVPIYTRYLIAQLRR